jgi:hypothetical protein
MSRLRSKLTLLLSSDSTETTQHFERTQRDDEVTDDFGNVTTQAVTVGASLTVTLPAFTAKFLYVQCASAVKLNVNGLGLIDMKPRTGVGTNPPAYPGRFLLYGDAITSLAIQNPGATAITVTVVYAA